MVENTSKRKINLVLRIYNSKKKITECLSLGIALSTYYFWLNKYLKTGTVENESRRPKHSPKKLKSRKIVKRIKELYLEGRGKYYIQAQLKREGFKVGTTAIVKTLKRNGLWS